MDWGAHDSLGYVQPATREVELGEHLAGGAIEAGYRLGLEWVPRRVDRSLRETQLPLGGFENVDRTNELLLRDQLEPPSFQESIIGRVQAYTAGYEHDVDL